jgi:hypothetical protein
MKVKITLNNMTFEREIPTRWSEVTFAQFLKIEDAKSPTQILAAIAGVSEDDLKRAKVKGLDKLIALLKFFETKMDLSRIPQTVLGYRIPQNLEIESIRIYELLKAEVEEMKSKPEKEMLHSYTTFLGLYCCEQVYGEFNEEKATQLAQQFYNAPVEEVLAVGNFTLLKLTGLKIGINPSFQNPSTPLKRLKLAFSVWVSRMVSTVRWYIWKRKLDKPLPNYSNGQ